jgi:hypothetical protein
MAQKPKGVQFEAENDPGFKVQFIDGALGNLNLNGGRMTFFVDVPQIEMGALAEGQGAPEISVSTVKRIFLVDIRMSPETFKSVAIWMKNNVDAYDKMIQSGVKPTEPQTYYQ